jgi:hypothetical protein
MSLYLVPTRYSQAEYRGTVGLSTHFNKGISDVLLYLVLYPLRILFHSRVRSMYMITKIPAIGS